jgi:hypothetical protein
VRPNTRISIAIPPSARTRPYYVAAACCTPSNLPFWDDFPHGFNRPKLEDQRARTLPIGDPASRLAYHLLRRARRPAFERVIFTAVTAVEWQA